MRIGLCLGIFAGLLFSAGCRKEEKEARPADAAQSGPMLAERPSPPVENDSGSGEATDLPAKSGHKPPELPKRKKDYETAQAIPGREGYVTNPWTGEEVDVRAIPPGTLVRDPKDPDSSHKFRVPQTEKGRE